MTTQEEVKAREEGRKYVSSQEVLCVPTDRLDAINDLMNNAYERSNNVFEFRDHIFEDLAIKTDREKELVAIGFSIRETLNRIKEREDKLDELKKLLKLMELSRKV
jgi:hypothetical protein